MSSLNITEYSNLSRDIGGSISPPVQEPSQATQTVTFTVSSVQSSEFASNTKIIRLVSDADCRISVGVNPVSDSDSTIVPAGSVEYFGVKMSGYKLSVIEM